MGMKYYKLFDLLARKGLKKTDLLKRKIISSPTLAKLSKGETVTTEILSNICEALDCQPGDIMEHIPNTDSQEIKPFSKYAKTIKPLSEQPQTVKPFSKQAKTPKPLSETAELNTANKINIQEET